MMTASSGGLISAEKHDMRCHIRCLREAPQALISTLLEEWGDCDAQTAHAKLAKPDILVTNLSDKQVLLPKILKMNQMVVSALGTYGQDYQQEDTGRASSLFGVRQSKSPSKERAGASTGELTWQTAKHMSFMDLTERAMRAERLVAQLSKELKELNEKCAQGGASARRSKGWRAWPWALWAKSKQQSRGADGGTRLFTAAHE